MPDEPQKKDYRESAGLRETFLAYLPAEVGEALSVVASYLYDQALEEGAPGPAGYIEGEFLALGEDLAYLLARFRALGAAGEQMTVGESDRGRIDTAGGVAAILQDAIERLEEVYGR